MQLHDEERIGPAVAAALAAVPGAGDPPRAVVSGNFGTPALLLGAVADSFPALTVYGINLQDCLPQRAGLRFETSFVGPGVRKQPELRYVPSRLSLVPRLFEAALPPDMVLIHTSTPLDGGVSLGIEVNILPAALEAVRRRGGLVVAQMNRQMPYTYGHGEIPLDQVDLAIEVDEPLISPHTFAMDDASENIGRRIAARVSDGATLQLGIGAVPDAVLHGLSQRRELHVWSEMISDGVLELEQLGALDRERPLICSFLFGSEELYSWVHRNERVRLLRTEITNDPSRISQQPMMTSVNTGLQVDLFGQVNASRIAGRIFSGFGGQPDFVVGALHSTGGQSIMALRSWHPRANVSTIVPLVDEPVTSLQPSAVITEQGVAELFGYDERGQAANLIEHAAHPAVRAELWEEAKALNLA
jgi:acyl-CoA hydrolase